MHNVYRTKCGSRDTGGCLHQLLKQSNQQGLDVCCLEHLQLCGYSVALHKFSRFSILVLVCTLLLLILMTVMYGGYMSGFAMAIIITFNSYLTVLHVKLCTHVCICRA
jgi:hypothetical protein